MEQFYPSAPAKEVVKRTLLNAAKLRATGTISTVDYHLIVFGAYAWLLGKQPLQLGGLSSMNMASQMFVLLEPSSKEGMTGRFGPFAECIQALGSHYGERNGRNAGTGMGTGDFYWGVNAEEDWGRALGRLRWPRRFQEWVDGWFKRENDSSPSAFPMLWSAVTGIVGLVLGYLIRALQQ